MSDIHIRCPIHGTLPVTVREIRLIDHPAFQRLRNIKQLGFADLSFPGATHSRYAHSLGAMHIATRLFDRMFPRDNSELPGETPALPTRVRARFRQAVRLAMLFHDLGHAPLSHTTEMLMPAVGELGLGTFAGGDVKRRATHEDYTLKIVLDSSLGELIKSQFTDEGITQEDVAELIVGGSGAGASARFRHGGVDFSPVLRQIVSSECDADRMDYLQRDSFYSGVNYGKFDADWLIDNVVAVTTNASGTDAVHLGIRSRAIFSFEDFLLSRYHMFATVYLHYTPVIFEKMLARYFDDGQKEFTLPADVERYTQLDDMDLWSALRKSKNAWARRIVERKPFVLLEEKNEGYQRLGATLGMDQLLERLKAAHIETIHTRSRSVLSKYFGGDKQPIFVVAGDAQLVPLEEYTPLYARYQKPALLERVFVDPDKRSAARAILDDVLREQRARESPNTPSGEA